ncbi:hypothetical protein R5R35_008938 [Gryllus longicercus]|uniref:Uncharacterized protein n=1 Tax=Gryllus longicercus TaxID=2509291 RepID=A0AAN9V222_9ORTH
MESSINFEATSFKTVRSNRTTLSDSDESKTNTDASIDQGVTGTAPPLPPPPPHQQSQPSLPQQSQHTHSHTVNVIGSYDYTGKRLMPPGALLRIGFTGAVKFEYGDKGIELDRASMIRMNEGVRSPGVYWLGGTRVKNMFSQFIGDYKQGDIKKETQLIVLEFFLKPLHLILDSNKLFQIYDNIFQIKMGDKQIDSVYSDLINNEQYTDLIEVINKMFEKTTWIIARVDYTEPTNKRQQDLQFNFTLPPFHHDMQQGEKEDSASNTAATSSSIVSKFSKVNIEKIDEEKIQELQRDYKQLSETLDKERSIYRESLVKHEDRIKEIIHNYHNERANVMEILVKQLEDDIVYMKNKLGDTMGKLHGNVDMESFVDNMKMDIDEKDENKKYIENFNTLFNYYMEIQNKLHHQQLQELQNKNHQQLQELQNENQQQLQELQKANQQIQELQQQIQQLQNANQQLQELQNANQQQFQQQFQQLQNVNQQQCQQLQNANQQLQELQNVNQQQCQQLQNANQQLQELQNVSQKLENTNKKLKELQNKLKNQKEVEKQKTELEKQKTELEKQKTELEKQKTEFLNGMKDRQTKLENIEKKKKLLETTFEKKKKLLEDMESQLNKLEKQKKQFEKQVEELQKKLRTKKTRKAENPETEKLMKRKATEEPETLKQEPKILKLNQETSKVDPKEPKTSQTDSEDEL